jgi:type I restriction enzyme S subunit
MAEKKNKPEIRFKGFDEEWVMLKLGELGSVAMNKRIFKNQTLEEGEVPFYKIGTFGSNPDAFISRSLFEEYKSKYPYPQKGDLLISASGSIGRIVEYKGKDEYFQDSNIVWLKHDNRIYNSFLKHFYSIVKWSGLEGSTIKRLYNKSILDTTISLPHTAEQSQIGTFFQHLDTHITLHKRKYEKLVTIKKSMLEKMFPQNGADVPEIRFMGFSEAWEEYNWKETIDISTNMVDPKTGVFDKLFHIGPGNIESFSGRLLNNVQTVENSNLISGKFFLKKETFSMVKSILNLQSM